MHAATLTEGYELSFGVTVSVKCCLPSLRPAGNISPSTLTRMSTSTKKIDGWMIGANRNQHICSTPVALFPVHNRPTDEWLQRREHFAARAQT